MIYILLNSSLKFLSKKLINFNSQVYKHKLWLLKYNITCQFVLLCNVLCAIIFGIYYGWQNSDIWRSTILLGGKKKAVCVAWLVNTLYSIVCTKNHVLKLGLCYDLSENIISCQFLPIILHWYKNPFSVLGRQNISSGVYFRVNINSGQCNQHTTQQKMLIESGKRVEKPIGNKGQVSGNLKWLISKKSRRVVNLFA